jgi:hypothetical protein
MSAQTLRIGCGAGFSSDRLDPALDLAERGQLDALVFECVGERTLAFGHRDRMQNPQRGYNPFLERRFRAVLEPCVRAGTVIITNMGVANPRAAAQRTIDVARELGLHGLKVAAIEGDDVTTLMSADTPLWEGMTIAESGRTLVAANAYLGADPMLSALEQGAQVIITGRVADPSMFLAYMRYRFGWSERDWQHLGAGTLVGHLLECAGQITGGYHADPGVKEVAGLATLGFPYAEVNADGSAIITKLDDTGGQVTARTVKEQMFYEVHDPRRYLTPDVTANFADVSINALATDRIQITGASGQERPRQLKATVAFDGGYLAEAGISYAGVAAVKRARLAGEIVTERMRTVHGVNAQVRVDLIGVDSLHGSAHDAPYERESEVEDVRVRCAMRADDTETAGLLLWELEALLCCGPAGGGGYRGTVTPSVITCSASVDRDAVHPTIEILHA